MILSFPRYYKVVPRMVGTAPAVNVQSNVGMAVPVAASRDESKKACPLISGSSSEAA